MISSSGSRRRSVVASAAIAVTLLSGCAVQPATEVSDARLIPTATEAPTPIAATQAPKAQVSTPATAVLPASRPVSLRLLSTGTTTELMSLGLLEDQSLEVPPGEPGSPAGWYNLSATPGERGPAAILGHANAADGGPGVFASLRDLRTGDTIDVIREDGSTATFVFEHGEQYAKDAFPTQEVYGNTNGAELLFITCDGYDPERACPKTTTSYTRASLPRASHLGPG